MIDSIKANNTARLEISSVESTWFSTQLTQLYTLMPTKGTTANANLYEEIKKKLQGL